MLADFGGLIKGEIEKLKQFLLQHLKQRSGNFFNKLVPIPNNKNLDSQKNRTYEALQVHERLDFVRGAIVFIKLGLIIISAGLVGAGEFKMKLDLKLFSQSNII